MTWYRFVLPDVGFSSRSPVDPGQYYILQEFVCLYVDYEAMLKDEWRHNVTITSDHHKHHNVNWLFAFHLGEYESVLTTKHSEK